MLLVSRDYEAIDKCLHELASNLTKARSLFCIDLSIYHLWLRLVACDSDLSTLHALLHLGSSARRFGSLRNVSVAHKEIVHRVYKDAVTGTNSRDLQRDLTTFENVMQAIRFVAEGTSDVNSLLRTGGRLHDLLNLGLLDTIYTLHCMLVTPFTRKTLTTNQSRPMIPHLR